MCEETFAGCPNPECSADYSEIRAEGYASISVRYDLDYDGDVEWSSEEAGEIDTDGIDINFYCSRCGHSDFNELDLEKVPEDCECEECEPTLEDREPDELVMLRRSPNVLTRPASSVFIDAPPEVVALYSRRSLSVLPVKAERAIEVIDWCEDNLLPHVITADLNEPSAAILPLLIPEPEEVAA